jgi:hypothetical protein
LRRDKKVELGQFRGDGVRIARGGACAESIGKSRGGAFEDRDFGSDGGVVVAELSEAVFEIRLLAHGGVREILAAGAEGQFSLASAGIDPGVCCADLFRRAMALDMEQAKLVAEDSLRFGETGFAAGRGCLCAALEKICCRVCEESSDWLQKSRLHPLVPSHFNVGKGEGRCNKNRTDANRLQLAHPVSG